MSVEILIPSEYARLLDNDWREAAVYGGRFCFDADTIISLNNDRFIKISDIRVGDKVLSMGGDYDTVVSVDMFEKLLDPKPMIHLRINNEITKTTYDHKYFDGRRFIPIYQLVWGIMDTSQRRTLELLCKQYGQNTNNELQGWLQNKNNETSGKSEWLFDDCSRWKSKNNSSPDCKNIYTKSKKQRNSKSQEWYKDGQQGGKPGMDDEERESTTRLGYRVTETINEQGCELPKNDDGTSERVITIQNRQSNYANKDDVRGIIAEDWYKIRWDKGFTKWKKLETNTGRIPTHKANSLGSTICRVKVEGIYETSDVWSITTDKNHNYFANGICVSNSLKSYTVACILLVRAMKSKIRVGCFREYQNSIADSSHQLLKDIINKYELKMFNVTDNSIVNTQNGSDFLFKGLHHNIQSVKSIEGIDIAWVEEAQTVSSDSLEVLTPTVRKEGSQLIYTYNRLRPKDPVHKRLVLEGRPNTLVIHTNYDVAEKYGFLPEEIKNEIEDDKKFRPGLYKYKWLGDPENVENRIYNDWAEIEVIPHEARLVRYGLDFGFTIDPSAIVAVYEYNGGYILDEIVYQKRLKNKMLADILLNQPRALVIADSAEPKSIEEIKDYGVNVIGVVKGGDQKRQGINYVQQQRISVTKRSKHIIESYENYIWAKDKDGNNINEPDDTIHEWSNSMDAIRYAFDSLRPQVAIKQTVYKPLNLGF